MCQEFKCTRKIWYLEETLFSFLSFFFSKWKNNSQGNLPLTDELFVDLTYISKHVVREFCIFILNNFKYE